jgi:nucleoid DNA-binding protein
MTLTKRDLVVRISNETGLVQQQVLEVVQKTLDYIADSLANGEKVELRNFGVFEVKVRKARIGRNPNAPETDVPIPQRAVVKFKAGKEMRADVLRLSPKETQQHGGMRLITSLFNPLSPHIGKPCCGFLNPPQTDIPNQLLTGCGQSLLLPAHPQLSWPCFVAAPRFFPPRCRAR